MGKSLFQIDSLLKQGLLRLSDQYYIVLYVLYNCSILYGIICYHMYYIHMVTHFRCQNGCFWPPEVELITSVHKFDLLFTETLPRFSHI